MDNMGTVPVQRPVFPNDCICSVCIYTVIGFSILLSLTSLLFAAMNLKHTVVAEFVECLIGDKVELLHLSYMRFAM